MRKPLLTLLIPVFLLALPGFACAESNSVNSRPAQTSSGEYQALAPEKNHSKISQEVSAQLQERHYNKVDLNDEFSEKILEAYLNELDGNHSIFLASDIKRFKKKYQHALDDEIQSGDLSADFDIYNTYQKRRIEIDEWMLERIKSGLDKIDLSNPESFNVDRSEAPWPATEDERHALWLKLLEGQIIDMLLSDMEAEDVEKRLTQRYENELKWLRQVGAIDAFTSYMSAYAHSYDPHTDYLSPRQSEELDISLNLSLQGIGAELRSINGYAEVVRLIPGGPAAKAGDLRPTDQIVAVAQGEDGEFVDVVGLRLDDTVRLIRGETGSTVRLQVMPGDGGELEVVTIVRDKVKLKDQAASKKIIEIEHEGQPAKVGLIRLGTFYNGTADDVEKLLKELKQEKVAGIVSARWKRLWISLAYSWARYRRYKFAMPRATLAWPATAAPALYIPARWR